MEALLLKSQELKVGFIPAKADVEEQERFQKEKLEPRLYEAQGGRRVLFFVDAAHFVLAPFLEYLWCFVRRLVRAPAGRQRFNVLPALNAVTYQLVTVTNDTYINAQSVCELLRKIAALGLGVPVTLFLGYARHQKCKLVQQLADELRIELLFLPSCSPNLNLIELQWKFVKKHVLNAKYYENFAMLKTRSQAALPTHRRRTRKNSIRCWCRGFRRSRKVSYWPRRV